MEIAELPVRGTKAATIGNNAATSVVGELEGGKMEGKTKFSAIEENGCSGIEKNNGGKQGEPGRQPAQHLEERR